MRLALCVLFALVVCSSVVAKDDESSTVQAEVANTKQAVQVLRERLKDPDSLAVAHVYAKMEHKPDTPTICIGYRARNGFGGLDYYMAEYKGGSNVNPNILHGLGRCTAIERNLKRVLSHGWEDITDEYNAAAAAH